MSILIISEANLRALKSVLMNDYEVSSSHGSELIAALCGFNSYAALNARLSIFQHSPAVRIDTTKFEKKHSKLGYNQIAGEWMYHSLRTLPLPDRPWLMHTTPQKYMCNAFYTNCRNGSLPFITIHKKRTYCYLEWDCISINPKFETHVRSPKGDELGHILFRSYQLEARGQEPLSFFDGSAFHGNITKLSEPTARILANEFFMQLTPWRLDPS